MAARRLLILIVTLAMAASVLFLPGCGKQAGKAELSDKTSEDVARKIEYLIYPTLGYPQIVAAGDEFIFEFDFTRDDPGDIQPETVESWRASIASSNGESPFRGDLEITTAEKGNSTHWPDGSGREVYEVYRVTAKIPDGTPSDLYDLEVFARVQGDEIGDSQPNSLSITSQFKEDYKVVQLTDIHVFDIEYATSCAHDRSLHDAVYLRKAIEQINLIHPDFVTITGDSIYGQRYMPEDWPPDGERTGSSEYEYEYLWAYNALSALDVPCFMVMGNHDSYNDTVKDGFQWWTETYGPLFYSFDYGNDHYTMINTMDWSEYDRTLERGQFYTFARTLQPHKWLGQLRSGGDEFGVPQAPPAEVYADQLAWIRDDLESNRQAGLRILCCHHDPAQVGSWDDADYGGYRIGGRGQGRLAIQRLCAEFDVNMVLSGHEHHDLVSEIPWSDGAGSTIYTNTTALEPRCDVTSEFPGYRIVQVAGDRIVSYNYQPPKWSYPYYKGVTVGQAQDMNALYDPAIAVVFSNGGDWSSRQDEVSCMVDNSLNSEFREARLEFFMPALPDDSNYQVSGTSGMRVLQVPAQDGWLNIYVEFTLPALGTTQVVVRPG
ncbi:MAG: hypothetical protein A2Y75_11675 [Candidatus Solincola sediminis]|uniref:Calcineurin-like phosphoesterase domain-containing protein n=1 Tax=Candidatus Solincola sediminis TaxID=1797199 RepID=A0A1F2WM40_9ACTN|nr:MAG: hypothetical protein A2Y75_11675 [Candidatus Solincola sediminis]